MMSVAVVGLAVLIAVQAQSSPHSSSDQQVPAPTVDVFHLAPQSPAGTTPGLAAAARSAQADKAFSQLFTTPPIAQRLERNARRALEEQKPSTKIVCGMVVIQADSTVDPTFVMRAPAGAATPKIRRIPPAACAE